FSSITFDIFVEELFCTVANGATLQLTQAKLNHDVEQLLQHIEQHQTSVISLPTAYFHVLCDNLALIDLDKLATLRLVIIGGEKLSTDMADQWLEHLGQRIQVLNTYGPTEVTVVSTVFDLSDYHQHGAMISIGKPLAGLRCYIIDKFGHICPDGIKGELCIAGDLVAKGYMGQPALTTEKFVAIAQADEPTVYRTGDLARVLTDGNIEFIGRLDEQIKIRGFRIEPGEIEHQLMQHPQVSDALVVAATVDGNKRLVAYVVSPEVDKIQAEQLRQQLSQNLPDYMVPSAFMAIGALPLTPNGKVDKKALPDAPVVTDIAQYVAPITVIEQQLCEIWQQLLGIKRVGVTDNFFDLGGHSLLVTGLIKRINLALNTHMSVMDLFALQS
ncbi:MAG: non-ribosomal peptide synthetase, partial [Psychrosphaera sp.]|nr:non-ribosomal peptide synthetase [Psychrosphaera sp.]